MLTCSGLTGTGLDKLWDTVGEHHKALSDSGELTEKRRRQQVDWTWSMVRETLLHRLETHPAVREVVPALERQVRDGELTATLAAQRILDTFGQ